MKSNYNRGYIGLIALLIAVALIAYLAAVQYQKIGARSAEQRENLELDAGTTGQSFTPIEKAQNIKNVLEERDRGILE